MTALGPAGATPLTWAGAAILTAVLFAPVALAVLLLWLKAV